jgi:hypothetical protein
MQIRLVCPTHGMSDTSMLSPACLTFMTKIALQTGLHQVYCGLLAWSMQAVNNACPARRKHYIPHRKSDIVAGETVLRQRRTSFTFRKARGFSCTCAYPDVCDCQSSAVPPTRKLQQLQRGAHAPSSDQHRAGKRRDSDTRLQARCASVERPDGSDQLCMPPAQAQRDQAHGAQVNSPSQDTDSRLAQLEHVHVHRVYDAIAPHFSATRCALADSA